ncbi:MAG: TonB-dependent receptor [Bacteroidota bacterium]
MRKYIIFLSFLLPQTLLAQSYLKGRVWDSQKQAIFGANILLQKDKSQGAISDLQGRFELIISDKQDSLIISFIGFEEKKLGLEKVNFEEELNIYLKRKDFALESIEIYAQDPITEQFSTVKLEKMDIYLNPVAQGDPLKAITALPASTTIDESANPSLRGSAADRSRVVLNGVPIYNPVRASQLNNQGFFSIFNPEIIDKQYVYASNPPLTYGNSSAGLVEINTLNQLSLNQVQFSTGLSNLGVFLSRKIKEKRSFVQLYSNYQFSEAYIGLNKANIPRLRSFDTKDFGLHFFSKWGDVLSFSSMNYLIDEGYDFFTDMPSYSGLSISNQQRGFSVNRLQYRKNQMSLRLQQGLDISDARFDFGNIDSRGKNIRFYTSIDQKWIFGETFNLQYGLSYDYQREQNRDSVPEFFFAMAPDAPALQIIEGIQNQNLESYAQAKWELSDELKVNTGLRKNIKLAGQQSYLSYQGGIKYEPSLAHHFLLSAGKYHNYASPDFFQRDFRLQNSLQLALDYAWQRENTQIQAAVYYKEESADLAEDFFFVLDKTQTAGFEFSLSQSLGDYVKFDFFLYLYQTKYFLGE